MNNLKNKKWFYLSLISLILTLGVHAYLTLHFYDLKLGTSAGEAICNISGKLNCDAVTASKYSSVLGIPVALWGFYTNLILMFLTLVAGFGFSSQPERISRLSFLISAVVLATSLVMGTISAIFMGVYCLFCIFAYVLSFLNFIFQFNWKDSQNKGLSENIGSDITSLFSELKWVSGSLIAIPALAFFSNSVYLDSAGYGRFNEYMQEALINWEQNQAEQFSAHGLNAGPENAKMSIVEFADFRCPHCKHAAPTIKAFLASHPDVSFKFKTFPLDGNCNPSPNLQKGDDTTCLLAKTVFCSEKVEKKGLEVFEGVFENQEKFRDYSTAKTELKGLLTQWGITSDLTPCIEDPSTLEEIKNMAQEGINANIHGTPTIFVNNKKLEMGQALPVLQKVYEKINQ